MSNHTEKTFCAKCGAECKPSIFYDAEKTRPMDTGYGIEPETDRKICFACCGENDAETLRKEGKLHGYLTIKEGSRGEKALKTSNNAVFTNWPGTFRVDVSFISRSRNNWNALRIDFWFSWEGRKYWGYSFGSMSDCATVKLVRG